MRKLPDVNQVQLVKIERGGVPIPVGKDTKLQRMDVVTLVGLKDAVSRVGAMFGRVVRPSTATAILNLFRLHFFSCPSGFRFLGAALI